MAYFDTDKAAGITEITSGFYRLVKSIFARLMLSMVKPPRVPEEIVAAQHRAEAHSRAVNNLLR